MSAAEIKLSMQTKSSNTKWPLIALALALCSAASAQPGAPWKTWDPHYRLYNPQQASPAVSAAERPMTPEEAKWLAGGLLLMMSPMFVAMFRYYVMGKKQ